RHMMTRTCRVEFSVYNLKEDMDVTMGLKSVIYHFRKNREFGRLRIGIGRPPGQMDPKAFVLQKFNKTGRERIDSAIKEGCDILKMVVTKGLTEAARASNVDQKYKHLVSHDQQL
uniref:Aminoacyl-tRNA hydrolase n=1 Tax=Aegilops tauschii subsp. strangulata TaxID=200361 RepID=A0A453DDP6_AEGTS